jgi:hypothetical protein
MIKQSTIKQSTKVFLKQFLKRKDDWSIGIYTGATPFQLTAPENVTNPVLTAKDVTDIPAEFVADPFMIQKDGVWYMFFEVLNQRDDLGDIALATSQNGLDWTYRQVVLDEPFHLSYPYVFQWKGEYYMIPETYQANSVRLYKAIDFPTQWVFEKTLLEGSNYVDSSIFCLNERWWMFTSTTDNDSLRLYHAVEPTGPWIEHCKSPLIEHNKSIARPAGRVVVLKDQAIRYAQDCTHNYGSQVYAFHIKELTTTSYREEQQQGVVIGKSGSGWNRSGMHNVDPYQMEDGCWLACIDGYDKKLVFRSGFELKW